MRQQWGNDRVQILPAEAGLSAEVTHLIGTAPTAIRRESGAKAIILEAEVGDWRVRIGDHLPRTFVAADVDIVLNEIADVGHGYETGDGPLRLTDTTAAYADGGETLNFNDANPDTIVRSLGVPGSFITDGFTVGMEITITGTVSNNTTYTIAGVAALTLTLVAGDAVVVETIAGAGVTILGSSLPQGLDLATDYWIVKIDDDTYALALTPGAANRIKQTGLNSTSEEDALRVDITTAGSADTNTLGGTASMVATAVNGSVDNGVLIDAADGRPGSMLVISARVVTVLGFDAADALAHWQV